MMKLAIVLLLAASALGAQTTPPKLPPCDTSSVLSKAKPIYDVGTITLNKACPAFAKSISEWYKLNPFTHEWSADRVIAAILGDSVVAEVGVFNRFVMDSTGLHGVWDADAVVGHTRCVYVVARNAKGIALTGRIVHLSSSDSAIASIDPSGVCPDTTVNPVFMFGSAAFRKA